MTNENGESQKGRTHKLNFKTGVEGIGAFILFLLILLLSLLPVLAFLGLFFKPTVYRVLRIEANPITNLIMLVLGIIGGLILFAIFIGIIIKKVDPEKIIKSEINTLIKILDRYSEIDNQVYAIKRLGELKAESAIDSLIKVANGETININSTEKMQALQAHLQLSTLKEEVAQALGEIGDSKAVIPLIAMLKVSDYGQSHNYAITALSKIGEPSVEPLIAALNVDESSIRQHAAQALGEIGDKRALNPLKRICEIEDNPYIISHYKESIKKIEQIQK